MSSNQSACQALYKVFARSPVSNTHCHHLPDYDMSRLTLFSLLKRSYVGWIMPDLDEDHLDNRQRFFDTYHCNSYAYWLVRAIEALYPVDKPLSMASWDEYDHQIRKKHQQSEHHLQLLRKDCRYEAVILDQYQDPGSDNEHPDLFRPTFRCDSFFSGYDLKRRDHDGVSPYDMFDLPDDLTLPEYLAAIRQKIKYEKETQGVVALKVAIAYERDLNFHRQSINKAAAGFRHDNATAHDIRAFQDYLMDQLLVYAAEFDLPVQIHTGLGQLKGTRAMALCDIIERHPDVRYDLFHASFPWTDDVLALAHNFNNVYVDLCWLPILSTTRAVTFIQEALEVTDAGRLLWGCDTWTSEESYGALLAAQHALATALGSMTNDRRFSIDQAATIGKRILHQNTQDLFRLS